MASFTANNISFTYPNNDAPALSEVSFTILPGEFIVLCGPSGCGKTTLLRHLKPALAPHGVRAGEILFEDVPLESLSHRAQSKKIGFVMQSPENQIVTDKVWHELAFGLESLGLASQDIRRRTAEMASFFGIQGWFYKNVTELSGGQKQLLNLASVMAMQPSALILDEPTSQLDPIAASDFLGAVAKINRELGITVVMTEHRLEEVFPLADRVICMDSGRIICEGTPKAVAESLRAHRHAMFLAMPAPMRIWSAVANERPCPVNIREGREWLNSISAGRALCQIAEAEQRAAQAKAAIELADVWFRYDKALPDVVKGLNVKVREAELFGILGSNGTGKTTALTLISGINKPYRGKISLFGEALGKITEDRLFGGLLGVLPQNPQAFFVKKTVREDLLEVLTKEKLAKNEKDGMLSAVAKLCRIETLLASHPYDLSGGEQQRAALAKVLLLKPRVLLLDEPTKGFDAEFKRAFAAILRGLTNSGVTIVMVSHDIEFCAEYCDRLAMFFDGSIVSEGAKTAFFTGNSFYTTAANRMARHLLPTAVTADDVVAALGGKTEPFEPAHFDGGGYFGRSEPAVPVSPPLSFQQPKGSRGLHKRTLLAAVMILLAIPLTIYFGMYYLNDRKYYFISILVILETMLPFVLVFEGRKPKARELVIIAVLCAIGVAGRSAFFMLPQFKPVAAIVIIAGVAFGGETGFLVGAVTGFVSNMFFGQGPWTPWQMFAFGMIGFLAGVLFQKGVLLRKSLPLGIFGGIATFLIYGILMDSSVVLMYQEKPAWEMFLLAYARGVPFNLIHAAATVFFLLLCARPMLDKLDRVKLKYGLVE